jgi:hypothetical protein
VDWSGTGHLVSGLLGCRRLGGQLWLDYTGSSKEKGGLVKDPGWALMSFRSLRMIHSKTFHHSLFKQKERKKEKKTFHSTVLARFSRSIFGRDRGETEGAV